MSKTTRDKQETKPQKRLESSLEADGEELFVASVTMEHKGPLPHPSILRGYQQIDPTYPDRILTEFDKNSDYVRRCEEKALDAQIAEHRLGQWMAFIMSMVLLGIMALSIYEGNTTFAGVSGVAFFGMLISSFLRKNNHSRNDDH